LRNTLIIINSMGRNHQDEAEKAFGRQLSALLVEGRKRMGRSVSDVAAAIGASRHGLYAVEKGKVHSPGFRTVYLLAREYELDLTELARNAEGDSR
jgi:transcriptional regulator with XRE-family HTH domain